MRKFDLIVILFLVWIQIALITNFAIATPQCFVMPLNEKVKNSENIFIANLTSIQKLNEYSQNVNFEIKENLKGEKAEKSFVFSDTKTEIGMYFDSEEIHREFLFFGKVYENQFQRFGCDFLIRLPDARTDEIRKILENAKSSEQENEAIQWGTQNLSIEAFPGAPFNLNFTSNIFFEKLEVKVSENISHLLVSTNQFLEKIEPDTPTDIAVVLYIPPEAREGWNNGTLTLVSEGTDLLNPMKINIFVPTIYREEIPQEDGYSFVTIATTSHSQFSEDTMNISQYLVFPNGTSFLMNVFYDVYVEPKKEPPLKQISSGVLPENVTCNKEFQLIFKSSDNSPACVKPQSIPKLIERGWANG